MSYYLDRQGRRTNVVDGSGNRILAYSLSGRILGETNVSGTLAEIGLVHAYDEFQRRTNLSAYSASGLMLSQRYAFDGASRLTNAAQGYFSAAYSYFAGGKPRLRGTFTLRACSLPSALALVAPRPRARA